MKTFPKPVKKKGNPRWGVYRKYSIPEKIKWEGDPLLEPYYPGIAKITPELYAEVKRRSKGKCEICGKRKSKEIHHLAGRKRKAWSGNLKDLCWECHNRSGSKEAIHHNENVYIKEMKILQEIYFAMRYTEEQVKFLLGTKDKRLF